MLQKPKVLANVDVKKHESYYLYIKNVNIKRVKLRKKYGHILTLT